MNAVMTNNIEIADQHGREVAAGERFEFGKNWAAFLAVLDDERIAKAEESLKEMLEVESLDGKTFLDIGSGSGLFSLAARRLGAKVHSFDFDSSSFACTQELRNRYFPHDNNWRVEQGSALDADYLGSLGTFDIVYSWGVLHHTGAMWQALENAVIPTKKGGKLFVAIYNDTGSQARRWHWIKKTYCRSPWLLKTPFAIAVSIPDEAKNLLRSLFTGRPQAYIHSWTRYKNGRGMNRWHDIIDWVGGYPYEVATVDEIFDFYTERRFSLTKVKSGGVGLGCNEFVFERG
ncbi:MAG TPA: class I SAM-dependent methyltransferase [Pyrinomonadaceae bacterium]|jgi:2-polyprenyl-6-hydroxyphenyl methylase/3-demethylubiquinone-9 3-methyltransferase|nr:class I SAM-dependent methyltransferase [Pyrinomonadaceae bacterium]